MSIDINKKELQRELRRIYDFFDYKRSKVMSVASLEELAKLPKNTLLNFLTIGRPLPQKHIYKVVEVLEYFGYKPVFDWSWIISKYS
jgi:hypothetical protein